MILNVMESKLGLSDIIHDHELHLILTPTDDELLPLLTSCGVYPSL